MNEKVLTGINNAVNGCGRSTAQEAYEQSLDLLFGTLDELDKLLSGPRYLCGDVQTEADWRFYPNLIRFDPIYYVGYKCNLRRLEDYHHLSNYLRDLLPDAGHRRGERRRLDEAAGVLARGSDRRQRRRPAAGLSSISPARTTGTGSPSRRDAAGTDRFPRLEGKS